MNDDDDSFDVRPGDMIYPTKKFYDEQALIGPWRPRGWRIWWDRLRSWTWNVPTQERDRWQWDESVDSRPGAFNAVHRYSDRR
jgi:hypothetical protein